MTIVSFVQADLLEETFRFKVLRDVLIVRSSSPIEGFLKICKIIVWTSSQRSTRLLQDFSIIQDGTDGTIDRVSEYHREKHEEQAKIRREAVKTKTDFAKTFA